ncbi:MAG: hypothetical protein GY853_06670 [PVC group bacterium]|nr:hypothetical protein [PVC group bacterium]
MTLKHLSSRLKWYGSPFIDFASPCHIDLELSTKCNLKCEFCFRQDIKPRSKDIEFDTAIKTLLQAKELGVYSVKFNWRGEALFNKDFRGLAKYAQRLGLYTMLNTSLSMPLSEFQLRSIARFFDEVKVSFDTSIPHLYEKIRVGAKFATTHRQLIRLQYFRELYKTKPIIISRRTVSEMETVEKFIEFFKKWHFHNFDIRPVMARNTKTMQKTNTENRKYCGHPSRRLVVDVSGNVYACCVAYQEQKQLYLGNVTEKKLDEIWNGHKRKMLIANLKTGIMGAACVDCTSGDAYK